MPTSLKDSIPVFVDVEASALWGCPIEVAWASWDGRNIISQAHLIIPDPAWDIESIWDPTAAQLHEISLDELRLNGEPCFNIARIMNQDLKGREVFTDSPLDHGWLQQIFEVADLDPTFYLRRMLAPALIGALAQEIGVQAADLKGIRQKVEADHPHLHRAEPDAIQWAALWGALLQAP